MDMEEVFHFAVVVVSNDSSHQMSQWAVPATLIEETLFAIGHWNENVNVCLQNMIEVYSIVPKACICPFNRVWRERQEFLHDDAECALSVHFQFYASWSVSVTVKTLQEPTGVRSGDSIFPQSRRRRFCRNKFLQYSVFIHM